MMPRSRSNHGFLLTALMVTMTSVANATDLSEVQRIQTTPRHFVCKLDRTFFGNVHTPGEASGTTMDIIEQSEASGRPVATIDLQFTPVSDDGTGTATRGFGPIELPRPPQALALESVRIVATKPQTIRFVARNKIFAIPLSIVETANHEWWLSISSADYPVTHTYDYRCDDVAI